MYKTTPAAAISGALCLPCWKAQLFQTYNGAKESREIFILFSINLTTSLMIKLNISYWLQLTKTKPQTFLYIWKVTLKTRNIWLTISVEYSSVHNLDILLSKLQKTALVWNETIANPIHLLAWVPTNQRKCKLFNAMLVVWITSS